MNEETRNLYAADRQDHAKTLKVNTPAYKAIRARDLARRQRVMELVAANALESAEDYYHAAQIMNHGDRPDDARQAYLLALRAVELGHRPARWLAAATYDRWQMYEGKPQKYGTNYIFDGQKDRLWNVDPRTTDEERAAWDVPPLKEQLRKAEEANRHKTPMSETERRDFEANAPDWLKRIIEHWRSQDGAPGK